MKETIKDQGDTYNENNIFTAPSDCKSEGAGTFLRSKSCNRRMVRLCICR